jgi:hypothetical protein
MLAARKLICHKDKFVVQMLYLHLYMTKNNINIIQNPKNVIPKPDRLEPYLAFSIGVSAFFVSFILEASSSFAQVNNTPQPYIPIIDPTTISTKDAEQILSKNLTITKTLLEYFDKTSNNLLVGAGGINSYFDKVFLNNTSSPFTASIGIQTDGTGAINATYTRGEVSIGASLILPTNGSITGVTGIVGIQYRMTDPAKIQAENESKQAKIDQAKAELEAKKILFLEQHAKALSTAFDVTRDEISTILKSQNNTKAEEIVNKLATLKVFIARELRSCINTEQLIDCIGELNLIASANTDNLLLIDALRGSVELAKKIIKDEKSQPILIGFIDDATNAINAKLNPNPVATAKSTVAPKTILPPIPNNTASVKPTGLTTIQTEIKSK